MSARLAVVVIATAAIILGGQPQRAFCEEQTALEELRSAVDAMAVWLGEGSNGQRWDPRLAE